MGGHNIQELWPEIAVDFRHETVKEKKPRVCNQGARDYNTLQFPPGKSLDIAFHNAAYPKEFGKMFDPIHYF
jgi:hypothetical protein